MKRILVVVNLNDFSRFKAERKKFCNVSQKGWQTVVDQAHSIMIAQLMVRTVHCDLVASGPVLYAFKVVNARRILII